MEQEMEKNQQAHVTHLTNNECGLSQELLSIVINVLDGIIAVRRSDWRKHGCPHKDCGCKNGRMDGASFFKSIGIELWNCYLCGRATFIYNNSVVAEENRDTSVGVFSTEKGLRPIPPVLIQHPGVVGGANGKSLPKTINPIN